MKPCCRSLWRSLRHCLLILAVGLLCCESDKTEAAPAPRLEVQRSGETSIVISWSSDSTGLSLEFAPFLGVGAVWQPVPAVPVLSGGRFSVQWPASATASYFRLHSAGLTTIEETSPVQGEPGVAVLRETVVRFSAPVATAITTDNFYAGFGGRKLLARVEVSQDRRVATLFYLEPMPGNTQITAVLDGTGLKDDLGREIDADGDGRPGGFAVLTFETFNTTPLAGTAVVGRVFASELMPGPDTGTNAVNRPLGGVVITVDGREQDLRAVTDANGNFTLSPAPAGRFFVHIDGRTVTDGVGIRYPDKAYYPFVGKAWEAVPGRTNNLAGGTGEIFLPLIAEGSLQPVSLTQDTTISFPDETVRKNPALEGVTITVPANSLFSDNGTRGGKVGIAPVPPDRLPGPLPPGLELPIVITVQTDGGLNFDRPAPICFPNLPDPVLKTPLPANSKQTLISFNHDKGIWEAVGTMTVSADGKMICTDPGAGILQPGWHGVGPQPDTPPGPPPNNNPPCSGGGPVASRSDFLECPLEDEPHCIEEGSGLNCLRRCGDLNRNCRNNALAEFEAALQRCRNPEPPRMDCYYHHGELKPCGAGRTGPECERDAMLLLESSLKYCSALEQHCRQNCKECWPELSFPGRAGNTRLVAQATAQQAGDPVAEQIYAILEIISAKLQPFTASFSDVPQELREEVQALLSQADVLGGGWAGAYLQRQAVAEEDAQAAYAQNFGIKPEDLVRGNAPAYPVLYAATVVRRGELFVFRGETGPYGQYSVFVPRDGALLGVSFYDSRTRRFGTITPTRSPTSRFGLPRFTLSPILEGEPDFDRDGLPDVVEGVFGTNPTTADSDGDGLMDGAEADQGTNPLDGQPVRTGIVGTVKTPGAAVDVSAASDRLAVAQGTSGVSLFNLANGLNPTQTAHFPAVGNALRVAVAGRFAAVADGFGGVRIIDAEAPGGPAVARTFPRAGVQAIAADAGVAYAGFGSGAIVALDLGTGQANSELSVTNAVLDLVLYADHLYALTESRLFTISLTPDGLALLASIEVPSQGAPKRRLFVGRGIAWAVHARGYDTFDVADPARPVLLAAGSTTQFGWRHLVPNGSGAGVAVVGANSGGEADVLLYDLRDSRKTDQFLTQFVTPGLANAVALFNGLAYVADGSAGLQVVNYLPFDQQRVPPSITLSTSAAAPGAEAGGPLRVTANAVDDVQVRQVEFYIDDQKAFTDGSFPFEHRFILPAITATKTNVALRARAIDTGGNATWSETVMITLILDATRPRILTTTPLGGAKVANRLLAFFSEPMNPGTLNTGSFRVVSAGPDGQFDTADDQPVDAGGVRYDAASKSGSLSFPAPLPDGLYRAVVTAAAADVEGNRLAGDYTWTFRVADAVFWSSNASGSWSHAGNWSTGAIPGPNDDVRLENLPVTVTVSHNSGSTVVRNLTVGLPLEITGESTLQATGTIELRTPLSLRNGTLKGSSVIQADEGRLFFAANSANILDAMHVTGDLVMTNSVARAIVRNGLALDGTVVLDNSASLTFGGSQTFNAGQIFFAGNSAALTLEPGTTLTLGPDAVVHGKSGNVFASAFGTVKLINQGRIDLDVSGGFLGIGPTQFENSGILSVRKGGTFTVQADTCLNTGTIDVQPGGTFTWNGSWTNQGTLRLNEGTLNLGSSFTLARLGNVVRTGGSLNLTGTLELGGETLALTAATGPWQFSSGTIRGGKVTQATEAGLVFPAFGVGILDAVRLVGDLILTNTAARAIVKNSLNLTGKAVLDNSGGIIFSGNQTFDNSQIIFAGGSAVLGLEPGTTLTLGPEVFVHGKSGNIFASAFGTVKLINQGRIAVDIPGGIFNISSAQFENVGTLSVGNGGSFTIVDGASLNTGTIDLQAGSTFTWNGSWTNQGTLKLNEATLNLGGTFTLARLGNVARTGGTLNVNGTLELGGETLALNATTGPWRMDRGTLRGGTVTQSAEARLLFAPNAPSTLDAMRVTGDLVLTNTSARITVRNGLNLEGNVVLENSGGIIFSGNQTFDNSQIIFAGGSAVLGLEPGTTLTFGPAAVVRGKSGNISASAFGVVKLVNQGLIAVDVPGGTLNINPTQFENTGTLRADGASTTIRIMTTPFTSAGPLEERNGGRIILP